MLSKFLRILILKSIYLRLASLNMYKNIGNFKKITDMPTTKLNEFSLSSKSTIVTNRVAVEHASV